MIRRVSSTIVRPISSTVAGPAHPRRGGLEDLELGGAGLRSARTARRWSGRSRRGVASVDDERDVAARPGARLAGHRRQRADDPVVVDQRRDEVAGELEDAVVALEAVTGGRRGRPGRRARGRSAGPRRPSPRRGRRPAAARRRRRACPAQAATSRWSSRRIRIVVASARRARLVSSTIIRNSSARSCEAASRPAIPRTVSSARRARPRARPVGRSAGAGLDAGSRRPSARVGPDDPPEDRAGRRGARSVGRRDGQSTTRSEAGGSSS